jgi:hypothetical protein
MHNLFLSRKGNYSPWKQKVMSFRVQASLAKLASSRGKLTALASHLTKKVNKAE